MQAIALIARGMWGSGEGSQAGFSLCRRSGQHCPARHGDAPLGLDREPRGEMAPVKPESGFGPG